VVGGATLAAAFGWSGAANADPVRTLRLRSEVAVAPVSRTVSVNQLLVSPVDGEWAACGDAARAVDARTVALGRLWVEGRLRECGAMRWHWRGPLSVRLAWSDVARHASPHEAVAAALDLYAREGRMRPQLDDAAIASLPRGEAGFSYRASLPPGQGGGVPAHALLRLETYRDGRLVRSEAWEARMHRIAEAWIATRTLQAGEPLSPDDFERRAVDVAGSTESIDATAPWPEGWRARGRIVAGTPLLRSRMAPVPEVRGGERVVASASAGRVTLQLAATALQDGQSGSWVRVRLPGRRDTVMARVAAGGQVEVK
jgi:flagella basal body P-ring formation protein FlgA